MHCMPFGFLNYSIQVRSDAEVLRSFARESRNSTFFRLGIITIACCVLFPVLFFSFCAA